MKRIIKNLNERNDNVAKKEHMLTDISNCKHF